MSEVGVSIQDAVAHIALDAPDRRNALTWPMLDELREAVDLVRSTVEVRALVVSGRGRSFCAGADLGSLFGDLSRPSAELRSDLRRIYGAFLGLADLEIPTICAVNGAAVGAGANIAMACDWIVAGPRARFSFSFSRIGLHPGGGASWFLCERVGTRRAMQILLDGAELNAAEAAAVGLVTDLADDPVQTALERATSYAQRDPLVMRDIKRAVRLAGQSSIAASIDFETWAQAESLGRETFQRFVETFLGDGK